MLVFNIFIAVLFGRTFVFAEKVLQLDYPNIAISAQKNGNLTAESGINGDIIIKVHQNSSGKIYYGSTDLDLLALIDMIYDMPPIWKEHSTEGFIGTFMGGSEIYKHLNVLDPENDTVVFEVVAGDLPAGMVVYKVGIVAGIAPDRDAQYSFTIRATDSRGKYADAVFTMETIEYNQCLSSPCLHNSTCTNTQEGRGYFCDCGSHFGGLKCDIDCYNNSLGVFSRHKIPDAQMSAFQSREQSLAADGRLHAPGPGWCGVNINSWLQVDLGTPANVFAIATEGHTQNDTTTSFKVSYSVNGVNFHDVVNSTTSTAQMFDGTLAAKQINLHHAVNGRFIRFHPIAYDASFYPCLKVEVYGCWPRA